MAKFRYIGDHARGDCLGYLFPRNIGTEVTDPVHITKLRGNSTFEEMRPGKPDTVAAEAAAKAAAEAKAKEEAEAAELERLDAEEKEAAAKAAADAERAEVKGNGDKGTNKVSGSK